MSNNETSLSELLKLVSQPASRETLSLSSFTQSLTNTSAPSAGNGLSSLGQSDGLKTLPEGSEPSLQSIQFGKPSSDVTSTSSSGSTLGSLLSNTLTGGVSNALGGGIGGLAGLGGLISGIASLFGGSSSPPPLQLFSLPDSIESNVVIGSSAHGGSLPIPLASGQSNTAVYTSGSASKPASQTAAPIDNNAIAAAVKNALLTSNTLGDVVAEI